MMKAKRMMGAFLFTILAGMAGLQSHAAGGDVPFVPQTENEKVTEERGNISIRLTDGAEGTDKQGVVFAYVKVADWKDGTYELTEHFRTSTIDLEQIDTAEQMEKAASEFAVLMKEEDGNIKTDEQGKAEVLGLETGVYLFAVKDYASYEEIVPFLVAIPTWNDYNKEMLYDIEVLPKHTPLPEQPKESVKTGDDSNGVIYGSVMALAITGVMLLLHSRRKTKK